MIARRALSGLSPMPHQPSLLALPAALGFGVAFVGGGFAFGESELEFGAALVVPVKALGDDGAAVMADGAPLNSFKRREVYDRRAKTV